MSWTKGEIVRDVFTEMGIASYEFDVTPEETTSAIRRLDTMMAEWEARGLRLSYPQPSSADGSSSDEESNVPDYALDAIITNLAIRLAPSYGKGLSPDTKMTARRALSILYSKSTKPQQQQKLSMPKGAGYKDTEDRWTAEPTDKLAVGDDSYLDLEGALNVNTD
jgi:hypothetical protein